jgi:hypothetical protein
MRVGAWKMAAPSGRGRPCLPAPCLSPPWRRGRSRPAARRAVDELPASTSLDRNGVALSGAPRRRAQRADRFRGVAGARERRCGRRRPLLPAPRRGCFGARWAWRDVRARFAQAVPRSRSRWPAASSPAQSRGIGAKVHEAIEALRLEHRLTKSEILAIYFNLAPYGNQFVGAERRRATSGPAALTTRRQRFWPACRSGRQLTHRSFEGGDSAPELTQRTNWPARGPRAAEAPRRRYGCEKRRRLPRRRGTRTGGPRRRPAGPASDHGGPALQATSRASSAASARC